MGRPCPNCGGSDRFYLVARPRNGGAPFWLCNVCRHVEGGKDGDQASASPLHYPTPAERAAIYRGYAAVAEWCAVLLWTPEGAEALRWLRGRGFSDETIAAARWGFHPDVPTGGAGQAVYLRDREAFDGARLGGLLGPQGRPKWALRGSITIPYYDGAGRCVLLRMRKLEPGKGPKYLSPGGVPLYAGGPPVLYGAELLADPEIKVIGITEGEFKARLAVQHGIPFVAHPGVGYFPAAFAEALAGRVVVLGYDVEARADPFVMSPGERYTLARVEDLTTIGLTKKLADQYASAEDLKGRAKGADPEEQAAILGALESVANRIAELRAGLDAIRARRIDLRVLRLPREPDESKVDLDGFILRAGPAELQARFSSAPRAEDWHARHAGGEYSFDRGGIYNGKPLANYQARIVETVFQYDGQETTAIQRLALRTPSGRRLMHDILDADWADDRAARLALRVGLREGTFDDEPREILKAIRVLSSQGDPPVERVQYRATGWERIKDRWHFLASDGAINAAGPTSTVRAEIEAEATGNHYAMCGPGDAELGAAAWLRFLRGEVCPQPLALILAAQAALPLIHRFAGSAGRTMVWLFHQSGALKTALTRAAVLALYGPAFTAERADGAPIPKWDATAVGLGHLVFFYRDMPLLIDDYKQGVIHPEQFKRFLHNYSESTGRTRGTKVGQLDRIRPARAIVFSTAEDLPSIGDYGMEARLLAVQLDPKATQPDALAELQGHGVAGNLAAFWRGFVSTLAAELDQLGDAGFQARVQAMIRADDGALPGHKRAAGALRQNRMAWLILSAWLVQSGHISAAEAAELNAKHLDARAMLARVLTERQADSKPAAIFLRVLAELLGSGDLILEKPGMTCPRCASPLQFADDAWYCSQTHAASCVYQLSAGRIVGFVGDGGIGLFAEKAFQVVSKVRADQGQRIMFSSTAVWQQLDADGVLVQKGRDGRPQVNRRNPARLDDRGYGKPMRVLFLRPDVFDLAAGDGDQDQAIESMGSMGSMVTKGDPALSDAVEGEGADGNTWDQNGGGMVTEAEPDADLLPLDPIRSHAWDQGFNASGRDESNLDPIDPMILNIGSSFGVPAVVYPAELPAGFTDGLWRSAWAAFWAGDVVRFARIARGRSADPEALAEIIKGMAPAP